MRILKDDLTGDKIIRLLQAHLDNMHEISPPESIHALDLTGLRAPDITFWTVWEGEDLLGCAALKALNAKTGEIKSMRTAEAFRGRGVASSMLEHLIQVAKGRHYETLLLETGVQAAFAPARALYEKYGFTYRGPFGDYTDDPNSVFMTKRL